MRDLDLPYYEWLRSHNLSTRHVVEYRVASSEKTLAETIRDNPEPVQRCIEKVGKKPIFVPHYSGGKEAQAAEAIGAELFGSDEETILKYFSKDAFKDACKRLGIETVRGTAHEIDEDNHLDYMELEDLVSKLLHSYPSVIIKGVHGSQGSSLYTTEDASDVQEVYEQILAQRERKVLVEPFLKVIASPNDQWVINRDGQISSLGLSAQLFEGLVHAGNLKGQYFHEDLYRKITEISHRITQNMAEQGYCGVLGIDYIISNQGVYPIENNARVNGSSYTFMIVDAVAPAIGSVPCWKFFRAKTDPCTFPELYERIGALIYDGKKRNCVFPYDCDALSMNGTFAVNLFAVDMYHIQYLERALGELGVERV
jgi:hypothetical protein